MRFHFRELVWEQGFAFWWQVMWFKTLPSGEMVNIGYKFCAVSHEKDGRPAERKLYARWSVHPVT